MGTTLRIRPLASSFIFAVSAFASAGVRPQVDLSLQVTTTPVPFVPGGHGTVTLAVHNAGPDTAGATIPNFDTIDVAEHWFDITYRPPPFVILAQGVGCIVDTFVSEPLPDGHIGLIYIFYFDPIGPGESRVCIYGIDFETTTRNSFVTNWHVSTGNEDDTDPSNDRVDYVFQAPVASTSPTAIPTTSWQGLSALGIELAAVVAYRRRRKPT